MSEQIHDNKVQLGCGTLIIIALIVMFLSGGKDSGKVRTQINELNQKVDRLERKIDDLSSKLDRQQPAAQPVVQKP